MYLGLSAILEHATENGGTEDEDLLTAVVALDEDANVDIEFEEDIELDKGIKLGGAVDFDIELMELEE